jgi:hypothetical protein
MMHAGCILASRLFKSEQTVPSSASTILSPGDELPAMKRLAVLGNHLPRQCWLDRNGTPP